jgi:hypothetical protein
MRDHVAVAAADQSTSHSCIPDLTPEQRRKVFVSWMKTHPEAGNVKASVVIAEAFDSAFPCN